MTLYSLIEIGESCGFDMSKAKMFVFLIERTNLETGEINESYDSIARAAGTSYSTAAKLMQTMQEDQMIKMVGKGKWKWLTPVVGKEGENENEKIDLFVKNYHAPKG